MISIDISGKAVLITGATGQLGRVMARTLAKAGGDIIVHYNSNEQKARELVEEIRSIGREALAVSADITDEASIRKMRAEIVDKLRTPDIVVANAVVQYKWTEVLKQSLADYESQFLSCVKQNVMLAQAFVPDMIEKKWGRVIGINTECAMLCDKTTSAYISGKRGMDGVLRVLAKEVGEHGITVNQVAPGWTISENSPAADSDSGYTSRVPLNRRGKDQEIANAVAFLASDLASFISGVYLPVCGGNVMPAI
ncbi:MAG: SDR family oxidoreductase [Planctomycetes bacterium]|nr:SDR family oxidoreductase [Planctomycetota bacterium]